MRGGVVSGRLFNPSRAWNPQISDDWCLFFRAASKVAPDILSELGSAAIPTVRASSLPSGPHDPSISLDPLIEIIGNWAAKFHLPRNQHVFGMAMLCLRSWAGRRSPGAAFLIPYPGLANTLCASDFVFEGPGWEFELDDWASFEQTVLDALKLRLREYRSAVERAAVAKGYMPVKQKRARSGSKNIHFEWAVLRICKGVALNDIANQYMALGTTVEPEAIRQGVAEVAFRIGIDPVKS